MYYQRKIQYYAPTTVNRPIPKRYRKIPQGVILGNLIVDFSEHDDEYESDTSTSSIDLTRELMMLMRVGTCVPIMSNEEKTRALKSVFNIL